MRPQDVESISGHGPAEQVALVVVLTIAGGGTAQQRVFARLRRA